MSWVWEIMVLLCISFHFLYFCQSLKELLCLACLYSRFLTLNDFVSSIVIQGRLCLERRVVWVMHSSITNMNSVFHLFHASSDIQTASYLSWQRKDWVYQLEISLIVPSYLELLGHPTPEHKVDSLSNWVSKKKNIPYYLYFNGHQKDNYFAQCPNVSYN